MRQKPTFILVLGVVMSLLTLLCLFNSMSNFRAAYNLRQSKSKVVAANLKIDYGRSDSSSYEEPLYTMALDLEAIDGSKRIFHWEGDPSQAIYPEEALDVMQRFAPGTAHTVSVLRGKAREIRLDQLEGNPEFGKGVAWIIVAMFPAITGLAMFAAGEYFKSIGPWAVFVGFGLMPLLGSIPVGWGTASKILNFKPVTAQRIGESAPFDVTQKLPNVQLTPKAIEKLPEVPYDRIQFEYNGSTLHGGLGPWRGPYDSVLSTGSLSLYIDPKDRWNVAKTLSWGEDFGIPTGMLLFFGIAFTGAGLLVRKLDRRF